MLVSGTILDLQISHRQLYAKNLLYLGGKIQPLLQRHFTS